MKLMTKNKAFCYVSLAAFIGFVLGIMTGAFIQQRNCDFYSGFMNDDQLQQIQDLIEENEAMVDRLIQLQQALDDYIPPKSSPDIERPSRSNK